MTTGRRQFTATAQQVFDSNADVRPSATRPRRNYSACSETMDSEPARDPFSEQLPGRVPAPDRDSGHDNTVCRRGEGVRIRPLPLSTAGSAEREFQASATARDQLAFAQGRSVTRADSDPKGRRT
ncbi:hypothetical protein [Nocardia sp. NPDC003963]